MRLIRMLEAASSAGPGPEFSAVFYMNRLTVYVETAGGADMTVAIEALADGAWFPLDSQSYSTDAKQEVIEIGPTSFEKIRANVTDYSAGNVTVIGYIHLR